MKKKTVARTKSLKSIELDQDVNSYDSGTIASNKTGASDAKTKLGKKFKLEQEIV
jgi:hypothetical protein